MTDDVRHNAWAMQQDTIEPDNVFIELGDWPGGTLIVADCQYPEAPDGGADIALPAHCEEHARTVWWCLNASVLWCDGGPPDYEHHQWPQ